MIENISLEMVISLVSATVAIAAYLHSINSSRKASEQIAEISLAHLKMSREIAESQAHVEYAALVTEVEAEFEETIRESKNEARNAIEQLADLLFTLNDSGGYRSYIEHRFMEAAEEVRRMYDYSLTYQTGAYLSSDLQSPYRLVELAKKKQRSKVVMYVQSQFWRRFDPLIHQQILAESKAIDSAKKFMKLAMEIDHVSLMQEASLYFWKYTNAHLSCCEQLVDMRCRLEAIRKKNRIETFSIEGNIKLRGKFTRLIGDIDRYEHLHIQDLRRVANVDREMTLGMVFAGTVILFVASKVDSWGIWTDQSDL